MVGSRETLTVLCHLHLSDCPASTPSDDLGSADPLGLTKLGTGTVEKDRRSKKK